MRCSTSTIQKSDLTLEKSRRIYFWRNKSEWLIKGFNDFENYRHINYLSKKSLRSLGIWQSKTITFSRPRNFANILQNMRQKLKEFMKDKNLKAIFEKFMNLPDVEKKFESHVWNQSQWIGWLRMRTSPNFGLFIGWTGRNFIYEIPHYYNLMYTLNCIESGIVYRESNSKNNNNNEKFG